MQRTQWVIAFLTVILTIMIVQGVLAKTISKEEIETLWDNLLIKEEYYPITGPNDKRIIARETGEGYLWGFFGLSTGGGWHIEGHLEAEVPIQEGLLQLYSKGATKWSPGFMFPPIGAIEPRYDREKYPIWEFLLVLRDPDDRQQIQMLKSIPVPVTEVLQHLSYKFNQDDPSCPLGQRCPRGELHYDASRNVAVVEILGIRDPFNVEVPLSESPAPIQEERQ